MSATRKDYQFLIGQRFSVGGEIFVVQDLSNRDEHTYVHADVHADLHTDVHTEPPAEDDIVVSEPGSAKLFKLNEVIQSLLVDEEIELFNPNYLAAR